MLGADGPPLDPSSDEAHRWVVSELAKHEYAVHESLWDRFVAWLRDRLDDASGPSLGGVPTWLAVLVLVLVLGAIAYAVLRTVRPERGGSRGSGRDHGGVLDGSGLSATEHRALATSALGAGRWDDAVLAGFRAVAAGAVERTVLSPSPGRTADETAAEMGPFFPSESDALLRCARAFDAVRYGRLPADEATARDVVGTDARVAATRPSFEAPTGAGSAR